MCPSMARLHSTDKHELQRHSISAKNVLEECFYSGLEFSYCQLDIPSTKKPVHAVCYNNRSLSLAGYSSRESQKHFPH